MNVLKCFLCAAAISFAHNLRAQDHPVPANPSDMNKVDARPETDLIEQNEMGFVPLFDGKTLDGWTNIHKSPSPYYVTNGVIATSAHTGDDLVTERAFSDFI